MVIFLSLYFLGFFHNPKKYLKINFSNSDNKLIFRFVVVFLIFMLVAVIYKNQTPSKTNNETNSISNRSSSEETSKQVYRQGYSDGQTAAGLLSSERVSAYEYYMSRGYNFSRADYYVYEMGYNDGVYGRNKQY